MGPATATDPAPLSTEPMATVSARGAPMLPTDMELDTALPSPPPLRTATTCTDMSWPPAPPSASLTPVLPVLTSRGLSSTLATARGALMLPTDTVPLPLLRTATTSTATSTPPSTLSASPIPATLGLTSRSPVSTPASTTVATTARGPLMPTTELLPLPTLSTRPTLATLDLTSRCLAFTPGSATATDPATFTKTEAFTSC